MLILGETEKKRAKMKNDNNDIKMAIIIRGGPQEE